MSSPMMNRMLGFCVLAACASTVVRSPVMPTINFATALVQHHPTPNEAYGELLRPCGRSGRLASRPGRPDDNKLLATFQNPVGDLISVPFQNNVNFPIGEYSRIQDVLNIQPVIPFHVSEDWLIISRWITPIVYQPDLGSTCRANGPALNLVCEIR